MESRSPTKRKYDRSLRQAQQEHTRVSIMQALEALVLEGRIYDFTMESVAQRAGVSYPTVYRHFPSRAALLKALLDWGAQRGDAYSLERVQSLPELPSWAGEAIPFFYDAFNSIRSHYAALSALQMEPVSQTSGARDAWVRTLVDRHAPSVPEASRAASAVVIRHLATVQTWVTLNGRFGLGLSDIVLAVQEGIRAQIQHLDALNHAAANPADGTEPKKVGDTHDA